ncbi:hypothetical protein Anas_03867 [Armadillidium nasatum]|uniref:Carboxylesterase type B domain-containing protein n=1 Tax=Armadillidium nasatum TaxID=96803 RepID=A0A5N5T7M7_9CRUS|nr:hypothetical protein Anas_03867 [Armadillidium nasatum]
MKKGKYNKVNIISGVNRNEGTFQLFLEFVNPTLREKLKQNFEKYGPINLSFKDEKNPLELTKKVYRYYLQREDTVTTEDDRLKMIELKTDRHFKVCHDTVSNFFAADDDINLYTYQLDHFGQVSMFSFPGFNRTNLIAHVDDLPYLFPGSRMFGGKYLEDENDLKLAEIILNLWVNFAEMGIQFYLFIFQKSNPSRI